MTYFLFKVRSPTKFLAKMHIIVPSRHSYYGVVLKYPTSTANFFKKVKLCDCYYSAIKFKSESKVSLGLQLAAGKSTVFFIAMLFATPKVVPLSGKEIMITSRDITCLPLAAIRSMTDCKNLIGLGVAQNDNSG